MHLLDWRTEDNFKGLQMSLAFIKIRKRNHPLPQIVLLLLQSCILHSITLDEKMDLRG